MLSLSAWTPDDESKSFFVYGPSISCILPTHALTPSAQNIAHSAPLSPTSTNLEAQLPRLLSYWVAHATAKGAHHH